MRRGGIPRQLRYSAVTHSHSSAVIEAIASGIVPLIAFPLKVLQASAACANRSRTGVDGGRAHAAAAASGEGG